MLISILKWFKSKVCFIKEQYETEGTVKSMDDEKLVKSETVKMNLNLCAMMKI